MTDNLARVLVQENYDEYYRQQALRAAKKAKVKKAESVRTIVSCAIAFMLAFAVVSRYMHINELEKQVSSVQTTVNTLKAANDQREILLENTMTLEEIEFEAKTRLGMNKPANNQIIYVSIQKEDTSYVAPN